MHARFGRDRGSYIIQFPTLATFSIHYDGRSIACSATRKTPHLTVRHLFLDQVLPLTLALRRDGVALHASAIVSGDKVIAFLGDTGSGKSTLAASFAAGGHEVFADDCVFARPTGTGPVAVRGYPGLRLYPDVIGMLKANTLGTQPMAHYSAKRRVAQSKHREAKPELPLGALFLLESADDNPKARTMRLGKIEAFVSVVRNSYFVDTVSHNFLRKTTEQIADLVDRIPVFRLAYSRSPARVPLVIRDVLATVSDSPTRVHACHRP